MKTNHSKLPWRYCESTEIAFDADGVSVDLDEETIIANIPFVLRCVNNFYPLLEACKDALDNSAYAANGLCKEVKEKLKQAISDAEGGES